MAMTARATMVGVFHHRPEAEQAVEELRAAGFREDQIGFAMRPQSDLPPHSELVDQDDQTAPDVGNATLTGALAGGATAATAALFVPAFGPVLAGGIMAATLLGAAVGATAGGVVGAMMHLGVSADDAHYYETSMKAGRAVVIVHAGDRSEEATEILYRVGAFDVDALGKNSPAETAQALGMGEREAHWFEHDGDINVNKQAEGLNREHEALPIDGEPVKDAEDRRDFEGEMTTPRGSTVPDPDRIRPLLQ